MKTNLTLILALACTSLFAQSFSNSETTNTNQVSSASETRIDSVFKEQWEVDSTMWLPHRKVVCDYDVSNEITLVNSKSETNIFGHYWVTNEKWVYSKNADNEVIKGQHTYWNTGGNVWSTDPGERRDFTYNADGKLEETIISVWDLPNTQYKEVKKHTFSYDGNDNLESHIIYVKQINSSNWFENEKFTFTYNSDDKVTLQESFKWDNNQWEVGDNKIEFTYNAAGKLTNQKDLFLNPATGLYPNGTERVYSYSTTGIIDSVVIQNFHTPSNTTGNIEKYIFEFDANALPITQTLLPSKAYTILYDFDEIDFIKMPSIVTKQKWSMDSSIWKDYNRVRINSSQINNNVSIDENKSIEVSVFPNPVQNTIHISSDLDLTDAQFSIYDMQGRIVLNYGSMNVTSGINVEHLPKGIYTYSIRSNEGVSKGKFVKN